FTNLRFTVMVNRVHRRPIDKISIEGYKSIRQLKDFKLHPINILIGANGSGKSNFVSFFSLLREVIDGSLQKHINKYGGADDQLFMGPKVTEQIAGHIDFGMNGYTFNLESTVDNRLIFSDERIHYTGSQGARAVNRSIGWFEKNL
ncbi:MAG: AAA family ATPase, partial [Sedimentisphaerales bacterium]|nr:AAA family ATPase [Sedimentisphaerales bacterium]